MYIEEVAQTVMIGRNEYGLMSNELDPQPDPGQLMVYQIRIKGHLGSRWTDWFGGLTITLEDNGDTLLTGPVVDQAALYGLLKKVRDLGMTLVSVSPVKPSQAFGAYQQNTRSKMNSIEKSARIAGVLYLILAVTGVIGLIYAPIVARDAAATAQNILVNESLFRFNIAISIISLTSFIFLVLALYRLLKGVNKELALLMVTLVVIGTSIAFLNLLNQIMALILLSGADFLKVFEPDQLHALVMVFLKLNGQGTFIVEIFWGLWLFPFGLLVFKSDFLPRILGVLLIMAGSGYLVNSLTHLLFPSYGAIVAPLATVLFFGELPIIFWLLIKGAKVKQPATREAI